MVFVFDTIILISYLYSFHRVLLFCLKKARLYSHGKIFVAIDMWSLFCALRLFCNPTPSFLTFPNFFRWWKTFYFNVFKLPVICLIDCSEFYFNIAFTTFSLVSEGHPVLSSTYFQREILYTNSYLHNQLLAIHSIWRMQTG